MAGSPVALLLDDIHREADTSPGAATPERAGVRQAVPGVGHRRGRAPAEEARAEAAGSRRVEEVEEPPAGMKDPVAKGVDLGRSLCSRSRRWPAERSCLESVANPSDSCGLAGTQRRGVARAPALRRGVRAATIR